jgi:DNA-binding HxlR family transcriptional regulator
MPVYKGRKTAPRRIEVCAVPCEGNELDRTLKELNATGWGVRQIYHEPPALYRIFAQRELPAD